MATETERTWPRLPSPGGGIKARAKARRRVILEGLFGWVLPVICFAVDALGMNVYGGATSAARVLVATELLLFAIWRRQEFRSDFASAFFAVAFSIGAGFALLTGVALLPTSLIGCLALIGFLGLVPFGTCIVYAKLCIEAVSQTQGDRVPREIAGAALAAALTIGPFVAIRAWEQSIGRSALAALDPAEPASPRRAWMILEELPRCDTSDLPEIQYASLLPGDLTKWCTNSWLEELAGFPMRY